MVLFGLLVACCMGSACQVAAPPVTPATKNIPSIAGTEAFRARCADLFPNTVHLAMARASLNGPPPTETLSEAIRVLDEAQTCSQFGLLSNDNYRAVLLSVKALIESWYDADPGVRAVALSGDRSGLLQFGDKLESLPDARAIAEYYVFSEMELRRVDLASGPSASQPTFYGGNRFRSSLILVDAATGVLMNLLDQQETGAVAKMPLEAVFGLWGEALRAEAGVWNRDIIAKNDLNSAAYVSSILPGKQVTIDTRFFFVSSYVRNLAAIWGDHGTEALRESLGRPYGSYLQTLFDGVERVQPQKDFPWVVPVEIWVDRGYRHFWRARLDRLVREVLFDNYDVRAMFALRQSESIWVSLLSSERERRVTDGEIVAAAYQLSSATALAESPRSRLEGVARVLRVAQVLDGREGSGSKADDPNDVRVAGRRRASRQLAEVALCLMNRAYLSSAQLTQACFVSLDDASVGRPTKPCLVSSVSNEFAVGDRGVPPVTEEGRAAYESALAALDIHWVLKPTDGTTAATLGTTPGEATSCELARLFSAAAIGRLSFGVGAYHHVVRFIGDGRVVLPPEQHGPLISMALGAVARERAGICGVVGGHCSLDDLERAQKAAAPDRRGAIAQEIGLYCNATLIGADIYSVASSTKRGPSLLALSRPYLRPLDASGVQAAGLLLQAEASACADRKMP